MNFTDAIGIAGGISTVLGFCGTAAFLYFHIVVNRAQASVRSLVEGERLFNAEQVLKILAQFENDQARLDALQLLTYHDVAKAEALLKRIKNKVNITQLSNISNSNYRQLALAAALLFLSLAVIAFKFSKEQASTILKPDIVWSAVYPLDGAPNHVECKCAEISSNLDNVGNVAPLIRYVKIKNTCKTKILMLAWKGAENLNAVEPRPFSPDEKIQPSKRPDPNAAYKTTNGVYWAKVEIRAREELRLDLSGFLGGAVAPLVCPDS